MALLHAVRAMSTPSSTLWPTQDLFQDHVILLQDHVILLQDHVILLQDYVEHT